MKVNMNMSEICNIVGHLSGSKDIETLRLAQRLNEIYGKYYHVQHCCTCGIFYSNHKQAIQEALIRL